MKKLISWPMKLLSKFLHQLIKLLARLVKGVDFYRQVKLDFVTRPDDIFLVTYPRSGTTWAQMILYQLSSNGNTDFTHISRIFPYFERSLMFNTITVAELDKLPSPRIFKSHLPYDYIPKGAGKYIYIARNGQDVAVSYYHFHRTHLGFKGDFNEFFNLFLKGKVLYRSWFSHINGWLAHKDNPNVLFLWYEDMLKDSEKYIRKIADFCEFQIEPEQWPEILKKTTFEFMKKHAKQFDPITERLLDDGLIEDAFFRQGKAGEGKQYLTVEQKILFQENFDKYIDA